ncbi:hypothetical protein KY285_026252 [Solanum tuberosum]|nr:hypothetical protein KY285_026252 [Solanum tuberosum]
MFWSAIGEKNENVLEWRDSIKHGCNPQNDSNLWPPQTRYQVLENKKWIKPLAKKLLEVLLKGLNVNEIDESLEPLLMGTMNINMNYYPPCPNPSITMGARRHCNGSCITLLFQDDTGGLYVRGSKGDKWIHVNPIKSALAVNIGDFLQIMSNDRYKSIEHFVAVDSSRARISVPLFVNATLDSVIGPFPQMLKYGEKPVYKDILHSDYWDYFYSKRPSEKASLDFSIQKAAAKWGCFQIINHGIPIEVLEDLKDAAHKFFELPAEEKVKYCKDNYSAGESVLMFWSAIGEKNEKVLEWRDSIKHGCNPQNDSNLWPPQTRYQVLEYQKWVKPLAKKLLEVLLKGLNVNEIDESLELLLMGNMNINMNYYPPCQNPRTKGDKWIHVNPIKGALAVNIGDLLLIMSNDRYKSIEHCVAVDSSRARISVPLFVNATLDSVIGPFPQMLKDGEKPVYKDNLHSDYWDYFYRKRPSGKASLDFVKI